MKPSSDSAVQILCPNCGQSVDAAAVYCPHCSQKIAVAPLRLGEILTELFGSLVTLELPILRTTHGLLVNPGGVASAWIAGKRQIFMNPFKFIVVIGLIVALTYTPLHEWRVENAERGQAIYQVGLAHHATQYFAFFCIALLIPIALAIHAFDRWLGLGRTWLDWYVLGLYTYGIAVGLQMSLSLLQLALPDGVAAGSLRVVESALPPLMLLFGAYGFVERGRRARAILATGIAQLLVVAALVAWQSWIG